MIGVVRRLHSPDVDDLRTWSPPDPECFAFLLQIMVGPESGEGEESFDVEVCTPCWLSRTYGPSGVVSGRHHLIVFKYDFGAIEKFIRNYVDESSGETWQDIAGKVGRLGRWEFED